MHHVACRQPCLWLLSVGVSLLLGSDMTW
jgi:hypothetical protein